VAYAVAHAVTCAGLVCVVLTHCGTADPAPDRALSTNPYLSLTLNTHSAVMSTQAPYDTLRLSATPYLASGAVLSTTGTPVFSTTDTAVTVSASGVVHALRASNGAYVLASLQDPATGVTHTDTVFIVVTNTVPTSPLATFAIQPLPGDSARLAVASSGLYPLDTVVTAGADEAENPLTSKLVVRFSSSNPDVASVDSRSGVVMGIRQGDVTIRASTTYYGVTKQDSVQLHIGDLIYAQVLLTPLAKPDSTGAKVYGFFPPSVTLGVGGSVLFGFTLGDSVTLDVVFDDPSAAQPSPLPVTMTLSSPGSGNIGPIVEPATQTDYLNQCLFPLILGGISNCFAARAFLAPGTYHYHSDRYGTSGTIIIRGS
jgi:hypothetical protein